MNLEQLNRKIEESGGVIMNHKDCLFCKIIVGDIPAAKVYEDDHVYAFLDISQVSKGHTLVIPKVHTTNIYDADADVMAKVFSRIPKIANAIKTSHQATGMNVLINNEAIAGQTIFHLHVHLIPKYNEHEGFSVNWKTNEQDYTSESLAKIANHIHQYLEH